MPTLHLDDKLYRHLSILAEVHNTSIESYLAVQTGLLYREPAATSNGHHNGHTEHLPSSDQPMEFSTHYAFALHIADDDQISVIWLTRAFRHITGFAAQTTQPGTTFLRVIHPTDRANVRAAITEVLVENRDVNLTYRILAHDRSVHTIEGVFRPHTLATENYVLGIAHDVTDRVEIEAQLQVRLRQQAALADLSQEALAASDFDALIARAINVVADTLNAEFVNVCQLRPDGQTLLLRAGKGWLAEEIGQREFDLLNETAPDCMLRAGNTQTLCEKSRFCSLPLLRDYDIQSGISVFIPENDCVFGVLGVHTHHQRAFTQDDINFLQSIANLLGSYLARTRTQDALRRSEEKFRKLLESASEGILLVDQTGHITLVNRIAQEIFGYTQDDLHGEPVHRLIPSDLREQHEDHFASYIAAPAVRPMGQGRELFGLRQDGSVFPIEVSLSFVEIEDSRLVICFVVDITERRQVEQQRLDTVKMRIELEKERELLNLKEQFMSMITHEFRSPLAAISSSCQLIEHYHERLDEEQLLTRIGNINARANQMTEMIDDVLTLTRAGVGMLEYHPAPLDIGDFCRDLIANAQLTDPGNHNFRLHIGDDLGIISADSRLLSHVFTNLLNNAAKYSPAGSTVRFTVQNDGGDLRFDVADEGIGIPLEDQKRLFKPFYRASNVGAINGSGLGLAVVKACVEAHGGSLQVSSKPQIGTTFTVYLPFVFD